MYVIVKVKLSLCLTKHYSMKMCGGSGGIAPRIRHQMEVSGQVHTPAVIPPPPPQGRSPHYPSHRRLGCPQSPSGHSDEEKISQPLSGIEPRSSIP
jgi:hypothetical protein